MAISLDGAVAVVTGGAGGIGSAICRRLAGEGATIVATYRTSSGPAAQLIADLGGAPHIAVQASVTDPGALDELARLVEATFGRLDVIVNNAGITRPVAHDDLDGLDDDLIDSIFATNWRGAFATVRALRPLLQRAGGGTVVNISSVAAVTGMGSNVAYCASKAAMDSMTRSLGRALAPDIRVISVSPGFVLGDYAATMPEGLLEAQAEATPLRKLATADDVAEAVLVACTALTHTTGTIIAVDGGRPLGT